MEWMNQADAAAEWLRSFGIWAVAASLLLNILISLFGVIPSVFLSGANAVVFGLVPGFFISLAGEFLGAGVSFWLYRWGIKKTKGGEPPWGWVRRLNGAGRFRRNVLLLVARLTPFVPSGVITFAAAASSVAFPDFLLVTLIGKAPSIAMETVIGHDLVFLEGNLPRLAAVLVLAGVMALLLRKRRGASEE